MYFLQEDPGFGGVSRLMVLVWIVVLVGAFMVMRGGMPSNPVRAAFRRRTAVGALVISLLGIFQLALRWIESGPTGGTPNNLPIVDWRLWSYLILLAGVGFLGYSIWYYRNQYKHELAAARGVRVVRPTQQRRDRQESKVSTATASPSAPAEPKPQAITTRRDARRERKRRKR